VVKDIPNGKKVTFCKTVEEVSENIDLLFIMTPWDEFKNLEWPKVISNMRGRILIDPYRLIPDNKDYQHVVLGCS
jgi:UDP-glucose 6-dehydrogenase